MVIFEYGPSHEKVIRENKGRGTLEIPESYIVLDTETTGLDPYYDDLIEFAGIKIENGEITDKFETLINPGYKIDSFITELTGITNEMLAGAPGIKEVFPRIISFIGDNVIVGHNISFDINFIYDASVALGGNGVSNDYVDTMRLSRKLFPEEKHHRLRDLVKRFSIAKKVEHRAMGDALQTFECLKYLQNYANENNIVITSLSHRHKEKLRADNIVAETTDFNTDTLVYGKCFVFTGTLEKMLRKEAMQIVVNMGGSCGDNVTKKTNYLVLGNNDYCSTIKDGKSTKQKKAEALILKGEDIEVISENVFYEMIEE